ncbi:hypothetical protein [Bradyrhizobium ottawaense]|uniref:hypothetical protein n=1 Tax=Bradyrhizobium ottawaense TaxID=931866 RepID=UPI001BAA77CB|nr:hypothetical protein [Bradyrhizobium ottawaense]MBR1331756.1 hypothetical protein [Bradyrhizobium ottawaense]
MKGLEFDLMQPPYFQLEEILDWIINTQLNDGGTDEWGLTIQSIDLLLNALLHGKIKAFASLDASPVQEIAPCTWTEFEITPKRGQRGGSIADYVVHSAKSYRQAALRDLSQPSPDRVPGAAGPEQGYHRVMSELSFLDQAVAKAFPAGKTKKKMLPKGMYAKALHELDDGKYFNDCGSLELVEIRDKVLDHFKKKGLRVRPDAAYQGLLRHYKKAENL